MHASAILHRCLAPLLVPMHRARLTALFAAVAACVAGPGLTLTDIARRLPGPGAFRHKLKRIDRLAGNRHLERETGLVYAALCRALLSGLKEAVIVEDWSDLKADQSLATAARLAAGGRAGADALRGGAPAGEAQQPPGAHPFPEAARGVVAAGGGADHRRGRGLPRAVPPRGGASRLALGGPGARAGLRAPEPTLGELHDRVSSGHGHAAPPGHGRLGAQQCAARVVRAGQPPAAGASRQDRRRQAVALEEGRRGRAQREGAVAAGRLAAACRAHGQADRAPASPADADRGGLPRHEEPALRRGPGAQPLAQRRALRGVGADRLLGGLRVVAHRHRGDRARPRSTPASGLAQASRVLAPLSRPTPAHAGGLPPPHRRPVRGHREHRPVGGRTPPRPLGRIGCGGLIRGDTSGSDPFTLFPPWPFVSLLITSMRHYANEIAEASHRR